MAAVVRKVLRALLSVWFVVTVIFVVMRLSGDPALEIFGPEELPEEVMASFRATWGIDKPIWEQYLTYVGNVLQGDFGRSFVEYRSASEIVMERLPKTLALMAASLAITLLIGIPAGIAAALFHNGRLDRVLTVGGMVFYATPNFVLGIALILVFSVWLGVLPVASSEAWESILLPAFTFGASGAAVFLRFVRAAMLDALRQPYVLAARARGLPWRRVVLGHVLPNAALPILTIAGLTVGAMVAGSIVVETMFAWPGIGRLTTTAVGFRDLAVIQVIVFLVMAAMVITNLVVDVLYVVVDPRIRIAKAPL